MEEYIIAIPTHKPGEPDPVMVDSRIVGRLVRCKECRFRTATDSPSWDYWCKRNERNVDEDDFCSDGEMT